MELLFRLSSLQNREMLGKTVRNNLAFVWKKPLRLGLIQNDIYCKLSRCYGSQCSHSNKLRNFFCFWFNTNLNRHLTLHKLLWSLLEEEMFFFISFNLPLLGFLRIKNVTWQKIMDESHFLLGFYQMRSVMSVKF